MPETSTPATRTFVVLHVGCGRKNPATLHATFKTGEWKEVRLDVDPAVEPHIVATITNMDRVPDGSVDAVWSSHNLEHLWAHEVPLALAEFRRVLRPDGFLLLTLPDLTPVAKLVAEGKLEEPAYESPAGPITPLDILYGYGPALAAGHHFMAHKTGFTETTLQGHLEEAGFTAGKVWSEGFDLWAKVSS
jgi:ubiquinone/menaquinone biosynthesis C-methylase UbiE